MIVGLQFANVKRLEHLMNGKAIRITYTSLSKVRKPWQVMAIRAM
ncbi:hypothetical protein BBCT_0011 [Bifidobacterium catenulatum DSM 16992 = JCM 1194 = LMG 11043]|uniref:Uncharacterized protein n=2 Tax=Bifidobacterium catenulatum DSM 16992 = JCM 1194 = LMG 11043 TaxID=566552 RepID=A0ABN5V0N9_9BIFI|nr:hypothetical protein BIFCAT_00051 [Bifidobacterium catenulatum DSM 16992 = JCM 1194 = LMG 11043]BAR00979.1 hypothetical protein BBCT_0011 [Bifidobacterium catenulatum DSM 16992 = JCM 1194 = LMG 11043]